jgi:hypothetical protein
VICRPSSAAEVGSGAVELLGDNELFLQSPHRTAEWLFGALLKEKAHHVNVIWPT